MKLEFCSLSSGSSGNCYYIGNEFHGILIDAGISARSIKNYLAKIHKSMHQIVGIWVSHNHSDHIRALQTLACKYHLPIYTTETIWENILSYANQQKIGKDCVKTVHILKKYNLFGFEIEVFPIFHDTPETVGFHINAAGRKITIVTDLGHICDTAAKYIKQADFLVIESNYDKEMLLQGSYPYYLKQRIISNNGHLDNLQTASFLAEHFQPDMTHICLAHLSKNNNTPQKATDTLYKTFKEKGITINGFPKVMVLKRDEPSDLIELT